MDFDRADTVNRAVRLLSLRHRARMSALLDPLDLHPGQEALLLELARTGPMIQAELGDALGTEPPSVTLMVGKLEASGRVRRGPAPSDGRASVVELTDRGRAVTEWVKELWCTLAEETMAGLPAETASELPGLLGTLTANVDGRRPHKPQPRTNSAVTESRPAGFDQGMALNGEYEPSALGWVRDHVELIIRTGTTGSVTMKGRPTVLMTYRGAKTGKIRKTPLMRVEHEGHYAAVASQGGEPADPKWYAALVARPAVELQDGSETRRYAAREVFGDEKALWWQRAVDAFPDYAAYQHRTERQIPVFVLTPVTGG
ncbi:nitroreductase/quinone reductase family protein [Actinomadura sp. B10D3]|uniref:nitroreductase/quinone reductase family protein n=1 Tax=Actinomadura sp. B10D3 TaxID=3153557 RepID=UPI00325C662F